MIRVRYNPHELKLEASGHAGYAEEGQDIVCAGASAILDSLLGMAVEIREKVVPSAKASPGDFRIRLYPQKERDQIRARTMLDMAYIGLERMENSYGQYIRCTMEED